MNEAALAQQQSVKPFATGLGVLHRDDFRKLRGRNIGLITNPTGILPDLRSNIEVLRAGGVKIVALYGPEHGVRGDVPAGKYIESGRDGQTGLPVFSLYGKSKVPTAAMLKGVDVLVFDIQDIGSRSYTYLSTLGSVMEGAARHKVPLLVLDRPNPLGLNRVEGSATESGFTSFVGKYPMAYVHGLTMGEAARMINGEGWLPGNLRCELSVQRCDGLARTTNWATTELPWVPTSPHIPRIRSSYYYAATGIVGELTTISIGIGYPLPFELIGKPGVNGAALARRLATRPGLRGWEFRSAFWRPYYGNFSGATCAGAQLYLENPIVAPLTRINFEIMDALRAVAPGLALFGRSGDRMFDLACGTDKIRRAYQKGAKGAELWEIWNAGRDAFVARRGRYLLYS